MQTHHSSLVTPDKVKQSQRDLEETAELYKSLRAASTVANDTKRMERINARLDSVTVCIDIINEYLFRLKHQFSTLVENVCPSVLKVWGVLGKVYYGWICLKFGIPIHTLDKYLERFDFDFF